MEGTVWNEGTTRKGCIDSMKLSARNTLKGTITAIHPGAVNAIVIMELEGGQLIPARLEDLREVLLLFLRHLRLVFLCHLLPLLFLYLWISTI